MSLTPAIRCHPLTNDRWEDFCAVMGKNGGFCGCWCMYWRLPRTEFEGPARKSLKARFDTVVKEGPPPGLLAYRGAAPVGWIQVGPRSATPNWNGPRRASAPVAPGETHDPKSWAISCFVVPKAHRRQGVATALLKDAIRYAKAQKAHALDACPVDAAEAANPASIFHGVASMFERAGFEEIARRRDNRPLMRLALRQGTDY